MAVARLWPDVYGNAVDPGWVPTRMGGSGAPDDLRLGHLTQEWLGTPGGPPAPPPPRPRDPPHAPPHRRLPVPPAAPAPTSGSPRPALPRRTPHRLGARHGCVAGVSSPPP